MPIVSKGYHGTTDSSAEQIIAQQYFRPSNKDFEWLGFGVYFFAYKSHAKEWANREVQKDKNIGKLPVVLSATLIYEEDQLLDLDDPEQLRYVNEVFCAVTDKTSSVPNAPKTDLRGKALKKQWCLLCNTYRRINRKIAITSYTFHQTRVPNGFSYTQKQLCVSDSRIISGIRKEV